MISGVVLYVALLTMRQYILTDNPLNIAIMTCLLLGLIVSFLLKGAPYKKLFLFMLLATMIAPDIPIGPLGIRLEALILLVALGIAYGHYALKGQVSSGFKWTIFDLLFLWGGGSILCSIAYATIILGFNLIPRDLFAFVRLIQYYLYYRFACSLVFNEHEIDQYGRIFGLIGLLICVLGIAQFFNWFNVNALITPLYAGRKAGDYLLNFRAVGTLGNPNVFGFFAFMVFAYYFTRYITANMNKGRSALYLLATCGSLLAILVSMSRTAMVLTVISVFLFVVLKVRKKNQIVRLLIWLLVIVVSLSAALSVFGRVIERISSNEAGLVAALLSTESALVRYKLWDQAMEYVKFSPVFGTGPAKESIETIVDNEYLVFLKHYGLVGLLYYFLLFVNIFLLARKRMIRGAAEAVKGFGGFMLMVSIGTFIFNLTGGVYENFQLISLLLLFVGMLSARQE